MPACVHRIFGRQAELRPGVTAILSADGTLTYGELDRRSNAVARRLIAMGVGPGALVGMCLERTPAVVTAMLGILKAGAAYLPLDPAYPSDRTAFMLEDAGAQVVVSQRTTAASLPSTAARALLLDDDEASSSGQADGPVEVPSTPDDLAYVMYTSGSTGTAQGCRDPPPRDRPPGARRGLRDARARPDGAARRSAGLRRLDFRDLGRAAQRRALRHPRRARSHGPRARARAIRRHGVTTTWLTAALFNAVVDEDPGQLAGLRELLIGGEALSVAPRRRAQRGAPEHADRQRLRADRDAPPSRPPTAIPGGLDAAARSIPIGRPIRDTTVYVLDASAGGRSPTGRQGSSSSEARGWRAATASAPS